jgi:hypothetical protein
MVYYHQYGELNPNEFQVYQYGHEEQLIAPKYENKNISILLSIE